MRTPDGHAPASIAIDSLPGPACLLEAGAPLPLQHNAAFAAWLGEGKADDRPIDRRFAEDRAIHRLWAEALATDGEVTYPIARTEPGGARSLWSLRARRIDEGVLLWATDVTQLAEASRALHEGQRDYVAMTAHELRGPLTSIKAWTSAAEHRRRADARDPSRSAPPSGDALLLADALSAIARQVDRMSELLTDLLEAARSESGATRAARTRIGAELLVRGVASAAGAELADAPIPGEIDADVLHLEVVLGKLVAHARASAPGPVAMSAEVIRASLAERGAEVHVIVAAPGPALGAEAEGDLFARFSRSGRRRVGGLYLCQLLAARSGGRVWHERHDGAARFVVALPAASPDDPPPESEAARSTPIPRAPPRPRSLLVADPDPRFLGRITSILRLGGYDAIGAATAARFWSSLEQDGCDAAIVDPAMPGIDGLRGLERIAASPCRPRILALSPSVERPAPLAGAERAGALAVLSKPVDWPHLVALINAAVPRSTGRVGASTGPMHNRPPAGSDPAPARG